MRVKGVDESVGEGVGCRVQMRVKGADEGGGGRVEGAPAMSAPVMARGALSCHARPLRVTGVSRP